MARGIDQEPRLSAGQELAIEKTRAGLDLVIEKLRAGQELAQIPNIQTNKVISGTFEGVDQDLSRWNAFDQYAANRYYRRRFVEAQGFDAVRFKPDFDKSEATLENSLKDPTFLSHYLCINETVARIMRGIANHTREAYSVFISDPFRHAEGKVTKGLIFARGDFKEAKQQNPTNK